MTGQVSWSYGMCGPQILKKKNNSTVKYNVRSTFFIWSDPRLVVMSGICCVPSEVHVQHVLNVTKGHCLCHCYVFLVLIVLSLLLSFP